MNDQNGMNEFNTKKNLWRSVMTHKINLDKSKKEKKDTHLSNVVDTYGCKLNHKVDKANFVHNKILMME